MSDCLKSSFENAYLNIIFQILFRCLTFGLNAFVLRHVGQAVIGVINVRLLLLESAVLFLSREAFRRACLSKMTRQNWTQIINFLWLSVPLCLFCSVLFGYIWLYVLTPPDGDLTQHYTLGVWAVCLGCVIEMCCEPVYIVSQVFLFVRLKVFLDIIHIFVRTITFTSLLVYLPQNVIVAFSIAQLLGTFVYTVGYFVYFHYYLANRTRTFTSFNKDSVFNCEIKTGVVHSDRNTKPGKDFQFESLYDFLPSKLKNQPLINTGLARLTWSFFKQGILKHILTEGERYIMTSFCMLTFLEQGSYDIVNNLGSLAARYLFRPVEESGYLYFSQMIERDVPLQEQNQKHVVESSRVLSEVVHCLTCFGLVIVVFGQSYSSLLLYLYGGENLIVGPGPLLMQTHCFCVALLAINGITECYVFATMNTLQLDRYNYIMAVLSLLFLTMSWTLTKLCGGVGFILANCCNMIARIGHSLYFIKHQYQNTQYNPLVGLIPGPYFSIMLVLVGIVTKVSQDIFFESSKLIHLGIGFVCFISVLAAWMYEEQKLISLAVQMWWHKSQSMKED